LKGLGEMDWEELKPTTMDADNAHAAAGRGRRAALCRRDMSVLMGDDVDLRKQFIVTNARDVRNLDF
jgi:DNA gyrase subunit B